MKQDDLQEFEKRVMKGLVRARNLGGYSTEASDILELYELLFKITQHIIETSPAQRQRVKRNDK